VNSSAEVIAEVPFGVVTVTSTTPADPAGDIPIIMPEETTLNVATGVLPKFTAVAPVKFVPLIVTNVPPATGPLVGEIPVTVGVKGPTYVYSSATEIADVPLGVVTVISTTPATWAGATAVIELLETTLNDVAGELPKLTAVAPVKPVPFIVTFVPPIIGPLVGERPVTVGAATYVNSSAAVTADVPLGVVTVTSTVPAFPIGEVAVIEVEETTLNALASVLPKCTNVAPVKFVPVIVTTVPPAVGPLVGERPVTVGAVDAI
jgi:hypothetical protein